MKKLLALLLSLVISTAFAQERKGNEVVYTSPQGDLRIQMCNEQMFRVTKSNTHQFVADEPWMVVKYDFRQYAAYLCAATGSDIKPLAHYRQGQSRKNPLSRDQCGCWRSAHE